jgi:hypothetical protein
VPHVEAVYYSYPGCIGSFVLSYEMLEWYKGKGGEVYDRVLKEL